MKRTTSAVTLAAAVLLAPLGVAGTATAATYYPNCHAALAAGVSNIHTGEAGYRPALDEDHDGVACEKPGAGSGGHDETVSHPSTGQHEGSGTSDEATTATGSTGSSSSSGSSDPSGSAPAQVAVVPQGGAETGDGSTEGHPVWWIVGVLLTSAAGLVGLAAVRRRRMPTRE